MEAGPEEDYIVYRHKVSSDKPNELVLCMLADIYTLILPNREPMDILLSSFFFFP